MIRNQIFYKFLFTFFFIFHISLAKLFPFFLLILLISIASGMRCWSVAEIIGKYLEIIVRPDIEEQGFRPRLKSQGLGRDERVRV